MLYKAKTKIIFDNTWINKLKFKPHTDYDLAGNVDAIAVRSESGSVFDFYKSKEIEEPSDFKYTKLYESIEEVRKLTDFFELEQTRIRIHRQKPKHIIPPHTDDNNINVKQLEDIRLRIITALNDCDDFIYNFNGKRFSLQKGESVVFEPDKISHGIKNNSDSVSRYALVQIVKVYPFSNWFKDFVYKENVVDLT